MPSLGADMESGTLLEWFVKPGDAVKRGDIVALVDTSKAEIEIEIFEDGVIDQLLVSEGMRVHTKEDKKTREIEHNKWHYTKTKS